MPRHHHHPHRHPHAHDLDELPAGLPEAVDAVREQLAGSGRTRRLARLAFEEGPYHRRVTNAVLCGVLARLAEAAGPPPGEDEKPLASAEAVEVELDLPGRRRSEAGAVSLPTRLIARLCPDEEALDEALDGLIDGPEHEVAANVILLRLLESLHDRLAAPAATPADGPLPGLAP
jgi:hypothetical protein